MQRKKIIIILLIVRFNQYRAHDYFSFPQRYNNCLLAHDRSQIQVHRIFQILHCLPHRFTMRMTAGQLRTPDMKLLSVFFYFKRQLFHQNYFIRQK